MTRIARSLVSIPLALAGAVLSRAGVAAAQNPAFEVESGAAAKLLQLNGDAGLVVNGAFGDGSIPGTGAGVRVMWYPGKAAFRAGGEPRQMTKAESKRMQQLSKKVGSQRQMSCNQTVGMQQAAAQMAAVQQMMARSQAPTQPVELAEDLAAELKKGKTVVRGIDWVPGSAEVSPAGRPEFDKAMGVLGQAIKESGQRYRLDLYVDVAGEAAAPARLQLVQSSLAASVGDPAAVEVGKTKRDKNPRLEVVKTK